MALILPGGQSRGKKHRGLHTKALMRDLGTRLECRQRVFVGTEKHCGKNQWSPRLATSLFPTRTVKRV